MGRGFITKTDLPGPRIELKPVGRWDQAISTFQRLGPGIKRASIKAQTSVAKDVMKKVKDHIRNQDLGWKKLSPDYSTRKSELGLDPRILIAYGHYYHAVEVWHTGNRHMVFVGVKRGKYTQTISGKKSRLDIATIAYLHEFSRGKRFPRRPLWNPTIQEIGGAKGIKERYIKYLKHWLRREGLPVTSTIAKFSWR